MCVPFQSASKTVHRTHWNRCFAAAAANLFRPHFAAAKHTQQQCSCRKLPRQELVQLTNQENTYKFSELAAAIFVCHPENGEGQHQQKT